MLIMEAVCTRNAPVTLMVDGAIIDGKPVEDLDAFTRIEGFPGFVEMAAWFDQKWGLPCPACHPLRNGLC